ncbi:cobalt-precorrin-5B (C(1))-methyltransferase CbiD [Pelotalea chapellei]|uniref:Cobalt-precorrin-5B C(1)-methyltransferase n=1 Tax=Pelotalea chapellei TaxID=44671 RepID=A0ABS5U688_9BACT|nr:cobalt-precorrin-5B (C(1))-methyltransferase CbiD [Pelotalea chapellei]MBT1071172.1 cobalamin biosynthesis protein CbiD [Pelotalea chapellei]
MKPTHSRPLRSGYTTGACAAAAAKGATFMLLRQEPVAEVSLELPGGDVVIFQLHGQTFCSDTASCYVIKDAGDDPDITNGAELHATVSLPPHRPASSLEQEGAIEISGGTGIGKVTKPGLAVPPGEWAINPVPRRMIEQAVREALLPAPHTRSPLPVNVVISIPDGEERAKKTLNSRLGIIGGLSILGTTGIVRPISAKAWTDTIDAALDVARACGCQTVVLSTGRTSELAAQRIGDNRMILPVPGPTPHVPALTEEAYIMMGDHVAYALQACRKRGFNHPIIACQFAKLLKIACGHPNTHAAASELDLQTLRKWATAASLSPHLIDIISTANTAREVAISSNYDPALTALIIRVAEQEASRHASGIAACFWVCAYDGSIAASSEQSP